MLFFKGSKFHLLTKSEVIMGKSLTQALMYRPNDSDDWHPQVY